MTDPHRPSDDELVSVYLDGEATPEEVVRVEREPTLRARLEDFRAAAALVADRPVADAGAREVHLRRVGEELSSANPRPDEATVHDLGAARQRRTRTVVLSAAAVVAALVLGAGLLPRLLDDDEQITAVGDAVDRDDDAGSDRVETESEVEAAAPESAAVPSTSAAQEFAEDSAGAPLPDLGSFATRAELDAALDEQLAAAQARAAPGAGAPPLELAATASVCAGDVTGQDPELVDLVYGSTAQLAGADIEVLVFTTDPASSANGPLRRYLVDPASCLPIADGVDTLDP